MGIFGAVKSALVRTLDFEGRAARSEFWWWTLVWVIVMYLVLLAERALLGGGDMEYFSLARLISSHPLTAGFYALTFITNMSLSVRRFHDINYSGWWYILCLVPIFGPIYQVMCFISRGTVGDNKYGVDPLEATAEEVFS